MYMFCFVVFAQIEDAKTDVLKTRPYKNMINIDNCYKPMYNEIMGIP